MSQILKRPISYSNPSLLTFRKHMIRSGLKKEFANVMTVLYLTTSLGMAKIVTPDAKNILGRDPRNIRDFLLDNADVWAKSS